MTVSFRVDYNGIVSTHQRVRVRASRSRVPFLLLLNEPNAALDVPTEADSANAVGK
jgi:ABC-type protease/lipase transport system fused ATPase/permease subunit